MTDGRKVAGRVAAVRPARFDKGWTRQKKGGAMAANGGCEEQTWYTPDVARTWEDIEDRHRRYSCPAPGSGCYWIFRGDKACSTLETKLERAFEDYAVPDARKAQYEMEMIREFQRKGGLYLENEPDKDDVLEWLALMRHYGAPTRLLDWTYSFYVAVFFALADDLDGAVWAFDAAAVNSSERVKSAIRAGGGGERLHELQQRLAGMDNILTVRRRWEKLDDLAVVAYLLLAEEPMPLVFVVNPFRLNRRLIIQQALFLISGDICRPFVENLRQSYNHDDAALRAHLHKIVLKPDKKERNRILRELRGMNISTEVLFPDLSGFAQSLAQRLAYADIF
jgi:hypothetical protein